MAELAAVDAAASFDLVTYISRYPVGSESRLQRLLFIAEHDPEMSAEAYQLAEHHFRETNNVRGYKQVFGTSGNSIKNSNGGGGSSMVTYDAAWVQDTERLTQTAMETLEGRLSAAQAQLQKEAIRTAHLAMGDFLRQRGDLSGALAAVMRSRDYCTSRAQTAHVCLLVIELAMSMSK